MMERTEWYPVSIKPVREGLYETRCWGREPIFLSRWTGSGWQHKDGGTTGFGFPEFNDEWRGLAEKPKRGRQAKA